MTKTGIIGWYDTISEDMVHMYGECIQNTGRCAGRSVEKPALYLLDGGLYVSGVRHLDRGNLMTDVRIHTRKPSLRNGRCSGGIPFREYQGALPYA